METGKAEALGRAGEALRLAVRASFMREPASLDFTSDADGPRFTVTVPAADKEASETFGRRLRLLFGDAASVAEDGRAVTLILRAAPEFVAELAEAAAMLAPRAQRFVAYH